MDKFISGVLKRYQERRIQALSREKQWPVRHTNRLLRLELVERDQGKIYFGSHQRGESSKSIKRTSPIAYEDLFKPIDVESGTERPMRSILVEGDAGIGKTTFCMSISEDWANGKLFQQFKLVLFLPLRHRKVASVDSFSALLSLLNSSKSVCESVAKDIEDQEGEGVLIIADGWDELDESHRQGSFIHSLLIGETFPFLSVLATDFKTYCLCFISHTFNY